MKSKNYDISTGGIIRSCRNNMKMKSKDLGVLLGFNERTAGTRMAQYEQNARMPGKEIRDKLAEILKINPLALSKPSLETNREIVEVLYKLDDLFEFEIKKVQGKTAILFNPEMTDQMIIRALARLREMKKHYQKGHFSKSDYEYCKRYYEPDIRRIKFKNVK